MLLLHVGQERIHHAHVNAHDFSHARHAGFPFIEQNAENGVDNDTLGNAQCFRFSDRLQ
jgi:hypothetical protein